MNLIIYLIIIANFCIVENNCRSIHTHIDVFSGTEIDERKNSNQDKENKGKISWKKLKPLLRQKVQRIRTVNGNFFQL